MDGNGSGVAPLVDPVTGVAFDCRSCGACCVEAGPVTVSPGEPVPRHLTRSVRGRMGYASFDADDGVRCMAAHMGGRCKALKGELGVDVSCGIYERRPAVCRTFPPGSEMCLFSREKARHKLAHMERRPRGYGPRWEETVTEDGRPFGRRAEASYGRR